jgi:hypothetical protein
MNTIEPASCGRHVFTLKMCPEGRTEVGCWFIQEWFVELYVVTRHSYNSLDTSTRYMCMQVNTDVRSTEYYVVYR